MIDDNHIMFTGAKIALICDGKVLTILRDDIPTIPYPNCWDLAGGGRENNETPFECVRRETMEELGVPLSSDSVIWCRTYSGVTNPQTQSVFMVGMLSQEQFNQITFGDEGQTYKLMPISNWLEDDKVIPQLKQRLKDYLRESL